MTNARSSGRAAPSRHQTARVTASAVLAAALAACGASAATARPVGARVVGSVTAARGANLYVKRATTGIFAPLGKGTVLYLGDIIAAGPDTQATVRLLATDASLPAKDDVLYVYKQLAATAPATASAGEEFGIAAPATRAHKTLILRRAGDSLYLTLDP